jgi:hypothetical protein
MVAVMALGASSALALEPKQCMPLAEINAALKAEGQRTLILGDREAIDDPTGNARDWTVTRYANAVTSNANGSLGYQLEGDLPRAKPSTSMCVRARLTNIRLYDANKPGVPEAALLGGEFDAATRGLAVKGVNVMFVADTLHPGGGGYSKGSPLVGFIDMKGRSGSMATMTAKGPVQLMVMGDVIYTPEGLRRLGLSK